MNKIIFASIIIVTTVFTHNAYCASFDCDKAKSTIEKSICANPKASKLDEELNGLYKQVMLSLDPAAQIILYYVQMQWLQTLLEKKTPREIINTYAQRIAEIKPISQNSYNIYSIKNKNITYQQINAKDAFSVKINKLVKNLVNESIKRVTILDDLTVTIKQLSNNIIKLESWCNYSGGVHPDYMRENYYFNKQTGKALTANELFDFTNVNYIANVMLKQINASYTKEEKECFAEINAASIAAKLKNIKDISLDQNTLSIDLNLCRACRSLELLTVSNDKITPFMSEFLRSELN
jgi:uncharacterized protein